MKLDRLLGMLTLLLQNDRMTAPELADKFEVSRRTIGRDIDALCQAGIPIVTYQGTGGGISIAEGFRLDKSVLTVDELTGIIAAIKGLGSVLDQSNIERTLDKLHANTDAVISMREPVIIDLASHYKGQLTSKIETIKHAIMETRLIEFDYFKSSHNETTEESERRRRIEPYYVIFQWSSWYVYGFCLYRQDWRMFKLLRLWNLSLCDEIYAPREIPPEHRDFKSGFPDENKLVALFDKCERYKLIESYGLDCYTETDTALRLEIGFTNSAYITSWLLSFGGNVKVLEPPEIAESIQTAAKRILSKYKIRGD